MPQFDSIPLGWPLPKRKKYLQELLESKNKNSSYSIQLQFQQRLTKFPVYVVPLDLPKYRLENGRTEAAQENYLALPKNSKLPLDFFRRDRESDTVQRVQHSLLYEMLGRNNLYSYFKDNRQTEPLILTNEGYVVNGNRRLCAMRMLYCTVDREKYSHFKDVEVVILPVCTRQDIDELEGRLQVQQDIKADYTWIAEACMYRARQQEHGYDYEALSDIYGKTETEIKAIIQRLGFVDEYLKSVKKERQYQLVEQSENAFKQIQKNRPHVKDESLKDMFTQLSYALIENSGDVKGRLYERIPEVRENLNDIAKKLSTELKSSKGSKQNQPQPDLFGIPTTQVSPITVALAQPENRAKAVEIAVDIVDGQKEKKRQKKKADSVLNEVSQAHTHLQNAANFIGEKNVTRTGVLEQITGIENSLRIIRKWLSSDG